MSTTKLPKFEKSIEQVEAIIDRIESGEVDLEKCLVEYETGMKLIKHCNEILETAEKKIAELTVDASGNLKAKPSAE